MRFCCIFRPCAARGVVRARAAPADRLAVRWRRIRRVARLGGAAPVAAPRLCGGVCGAGGAVAAARWGADGHWRVCCSAPHWGRRWRWRRRPWARWRCSWWRAGAGAVIARRAGPRWRPVPWAAAGRGSPICWRCDDPVVAVLAVQSSPRAGRDAAGAVRAATLLGIAPATTVLAGIGADRRRAGAGGEPTLRFLRTGRAGCRCWGWRRWRCCRWRGDAAACAAVSGASCWRRRRWPSGALLGVLFHSCAGPAPARGGWR